MLPLLLALMQLSPNAPQMHFGLPAMPAGLCQAHAQRSRTRGSPSATAAAAMVHRNLGGKTVSRSVTGTRIESAIGTGRRIVIALGGTRAAGQKRTQVTAAAGSRSSLKPAATVRLVALVGTLTVAGTLLVGTAGMEVWTGAEAGTAAETAAGSVIVEAAGSAAGTSAGSGTGSGTTSAAGPVSLSLAGVGLMMSTSAAAAAAVVTGTAAGGMSAPESGTRCIMEWQATGSR
jgi:hypothetical protein